MAKRKSDEELLQMYEEKEKKIIARKKELQQKVNDRRNKVRNHLMYVYGGKVEEAYKKLLGDDKRLYTNENINVIEKIYGAFIDNLPKMKDEIEKIIEENEKREQEEKETETENKKENQSNSASSEETKKAKEPKKPEENAKKTDKKEMPATNTTAPNCEKCGAKLIMLTYKSKNKDNGRKYWSCPNNTEDDPHPAFWVEN